ncbi:MAG: phytanoyl-CoA dioxygenase family protein [Chitinophagales bacterium]
MRKVLRNEQLESEFQKEGFVKIDFLGSEEVETLKQKFFELIPNSGGLLSSEDLGVEKSKEVDCDIDFTFIDSNIEFKRNVFDAIVEVFTPFYESVLEDYVPIIANFIRKKNKGGEVPLHQNWAFIDETKATSVSIWCPLVDMDEENGTLQFVPGSHKRYGKVRGPMIPWELQGIKDQIIQNDLVPMMMKAGQAVVLDDSVLHYSDINKTDNLRLAIQLILIPKELYSIHYHMNPAVNNKKVNVIQADTEFYMEFNPWKQPQDPKIIKTFDYQPFEMTYDEYKAKLYKRRYDEPNNIFEKLKAVFT